MHSLRCDFLSSGKACSRCGFTLVEFALVLAIVALILGATLVGKELIYAAEIRGTIKQFEKFNIAAQTFEIKYRTLPGDSPNPDVLGFDAASAGNGDGVIGMCSLISSDPCSRSGNAGIELFHTWYQLGEADLINEKFPVWTAPLPSFLVTGGGRTPASNISPRRRLTEDVDGGGWSIQVDTVFDSAAGGGAILNHAFMLTTRVALGTSMGIGNSAGGYLPLTVFAIDQKLDDGLPMSGNARAWSGFNMEEAASPPNPRRLYTLRVGPGGVNSHYCAVTATGLYNLSYNGNQVGGLCSLAIKGAF